MASGTNIHLTMRELLRTKGQGTASKTADLRLRYQPMSFTKGQDFNANEMVKLSPMFEKEEKVPGDADLQATSEGKSSEANVLGDMKPKSFVNIGPVGLHNPPRSLPQTIEDVFTPQLHIQLVSEIDYKSEASLEQSSDPEASALQESEVNEGVSIPIERTVESMYHSQKQRLSRTLKGVESKNIDSDRDGESTFQELRDIARGDDHTSTNEMRYWTTEDEALQDYMENIRNDLDLNSFQDLQFLPVRELDDLQIETSMSKSGISPLCSGNKTQRESKKSIEAHSLSMSMMLENRDHHLSQLGVDIERPTSGRELRKPSAEIEISPNEKEEHSDDSNFYTKLNTEYTHPGHIALAKETQNLSSSKAVKPLKKAYLSRRSSMMQNSILESVSSDDDSTESSTSSESYDPHSKSVSAKKPMVRSKGNRKNSRLFDNGDIGFEIEIDRVEEQWSTPKRKSKKGRDPLFSFQLSDSELERNLQNTFRKDRIKKAAFKKSREEARAKGMLQKGRNKKQSKQREPRTLTSFSTTEIISSIRDFLKSERTSFSLSPMPPRERKMVHGMATAFRLQSRSTGQGDSRYTILTKTKLSEDCSDEAIYKSASRFGGKQIRGGPSRFPKRDLPKARKKDGVGNSAASYRDGDIVGGAAPQLGTENRGHAMMTKMGWSTGRALGSSGNEGILQPVVHVVKTSKAGLG